MNRIPDRVLSFLLILTTLGGCKFVSEQDETLLQIRDIEGNAYEVIQVGEQFWMADNLRTTTLSDGTPITREEEYEAWASLTLPAYCWYNNDSVYAEEFGALYNYYTIETGNLCPEGWHVPTDEDWIALESSQGGAGVAGGAMKEADLEHWKTPNTQASNKSGFTALPGGYRSYTGTFNLIRISGYWWSSTEKSWYGSVNTVIYRNLIYDGPNVNRHVAEKANGFSVRCVKNP